MGYTERGYEEGEEHHARHRNKTWLMEVFGYEWCAEKEYGIHQYRHTDIEREYGVIVACRRSFYVDKSLSKARTLKVGSNGGKDGENTNDAVIILGQMTSKDDTYYEIQYLGSSAVERSPEQAFRRFLF